MRPLLFAPLFVASWLAVPTAEASECDNDELALEDLLAVPLDPKLAKLTAGESFKIVTGYRLDGTTWFKGDLHVHSRHSDGRHRVSDVAEHFAANGYDFISVTDHEAYGDQDGDGRFDWNQDGWTSSARRTVPGTSRAIPEDLGREAYIRDYDASAGEQGLDWVEADWALNRRDEFAVINGLEASMGHAHTNCIGAPPGDISYTYGNWDFVEPCKQAGGLTFMAHPGRWNSWTGYIPMAHVYDGVEVFNTLVAKTHPERALATPVLDGLLTRGFRVWAFANSDTHVIDPEMEGMAYNMVAARDLSTDDIIKNIEQGNFYASTGIVINDIGTDGHQIYVQTENATRVTFIGREGRVLVTVDGPVGVYRPLGDEGYVRVEASNDLEILSGGSAWVETAWSQPFWLEASDDDGGRPASGR